MQCPPQRRLGEPRRYLGYRGEPVQAFANQFFDICAHAGASLIAAHRGRGG